MSCSDATLFLPWLLLYTWKELCTVDRIYVKHNFQRDDWKWQHHFSSRSNDKWKWKCCESLNESWMSFMSHCVTIHGYPYANSLQWLELGGGCQVLVKGNHFNLLKSNFWFLWLSQGLPLRQASVCFILSGLASFYLVFILVKMLSFSFVPYLETRITACFSESTYPRGHGENMQTPCGKAKLHF